MASLGNLVVKFITILLLVYFSNAQLSVTFYSKTCTNLQSIVRKVMDGAVQMDQRVGASILRLFFHDCFANGCDASILLDDTPTLTSEKNAFPNIHSIGGVEVIDAIKTSVEAACPDTVSCVDILALAALEGVALLYTTYLEKRTWRRAEKNSSRTRMVL